MVLTLHISEYYGALNAGGRFENPGLIESRTRLISQPKLSLVSVVEMGMSTCTRVLDLEYGNYLKTTLL